MPSAAIIGAGPVGCLAALGLAQRGFSVDVFEARSQMQSTNASSHGRSINLAISTRGLTGLRAVAAAAAKTEHGEAQGLDQMVLEGAVPMRARMIHTPNGSLDSQPYSTTGECINSVGRGHLNQLLLAQASAHPAISVHYGHKLRTADFDAQPSDSSALAECKLEFNVQAGTSDDAGVSTYHATLVLGCDGLHSSVRDALARRIPLDFSRTYIDSTYLELHMPPTATGTYALDANHLHIWPRHNFMLIALPNQDASFTCTLFAPQALIDEHLQSKQDILAFFEREFADALPLMGREQVVEDLLGRKASALASIRCKPYHYKGRVVLLGDAAHAMLPFYGQGLNCGFEDVRVLLELIDKHSSVSSEEASRTNAIAAGRKRADSGVEVASRTASPGSIVTKSADETRSTPNANSLERALDEYSATRYEDLVAICELARQNYAEMSSRVVSLPYLARKRLDTLLMRLLPASWWSSLYTMVTFSNRAYADVRRTEARQARLVERALVGLTGAAVLALGLGVTSAWRRR